MEYDAVLIEQSIAKQYGILPSQQGELKYADWAKLVGGLTESSDAGARADDSGHVWEVMRCREEQA